MRGRGAEGLAPSRPGAPHRPNRTTTTTRTTKTTRGRGIGAGILAPSRQGAVAPIRPKSSIKCPKEIDFSYGRSSLSTLESLE